MFCTMKSALFLVQAGNIVPLTRGRLQKSKFNIQCTHSTWGHRWICIEKSGLFVMSEILCSLLCFVLNFWILAVVKPFIRYCLYRRVWGFLVDGYEQCNLRGYKVLWPPLWSSGQSSWLQNGDVLCFLWSTNWIYVCYIEESRLPLWSSGQSS
jgi:hypothetical protein